MIANELVTELRFDGSLAPLDGLQSGLMSSNDLLDLASKSMMVTAKMLQELKKRSQEAGDQAEKDKTKWQKFKDTLDKTNKKITSFTKFSAKVAGVFTGSAAAMQLFVGQMGQAIESQVEFANSVNVGFEAMQEWNYVAELNSSSVDSLKSSFEGLNKKINESTKNSEINSYFKSLGINVKDANGELKSADTVLEEVSKSFKKLNLNEGQQKDYLEKLGIDSSMLKTLNLSTQELTKLKNEARSVGIVTDEEAQSIIEYNKSFNTLKFGLDSLRKKIAVAFTPQLKDLAQTFIKLLQSNQALIKNGLEKFSKLIGSGVGAVANFCKFIGDLIKSTIGLKGALIATGIAVAFLNKKFLFSPLGAMVMGILALIAVVDDLMVGMEGGESVIANFLKDMFGFDIFAYIEDFKEGWKVLKETIKENINYAIEFWKDFYQDIKDGLSNFINGWKNTWNNGINYIKDKWQSFKDWFLNLLSPILDLYDKITDIKLPSLSDIGTSIKESKVNPMNWFGGKKEDNSIQKSFTPDLLQNSVNNYDNKTTNSYLNSYELPQNTLNLKDHFNIPPTQSETFNNTQNNTIKIEIKSSDPNLAGKSVSDALQAQIKEANTQFGLGGR